MTSDMDKKNGMRWDWPWHWANGMRRNGTHGTRRPNLNPVAKRGDSSVYSKNNNQLKITRLQILVKRLWKQSLFYYFKIVCGSRYNEIKIYNS